MEHCEFYECCELFTDENATHMPKLAKMFRERYCTDNFDQCARYQVAVQAGRQYVPTYMLPTQTEWAQQIVKELRDEQSLVEKRYDSSLA